MPDAVCWLAAEPNRGAGRPTTVTRAHRRLAAAAAALLLAVVVAGCGDDTQAGDDASATVLVTPSLGTTPSAATTESAKGTPPLTEGPVTVTGTVEAGVESGCLLIDGYLLVGAPTEVRAGTAWTVTGRVDRSVMTTCQQGVPVVVESAEPA